MATGGSRNFQNYLAKQRRAAAKKQASAAASEARRKRLAKKAFNRNLKWGTSLAWAARSEASERARAQDKGHKSSKSGDRARAQKRGEKILSVIKDPKRRFEGKKD